ncbi:uncharacterized protein N7515_001973 [Penicillium bovifimosum]|uniref:Uncharacterized protein n=1 Tax=Penicillium bovifimosum TaxID=126998 RepID=A0A9W9HAN4_9EURO|nr:uncharacterized protein N7515_001973 [Penicillium bovifimosum]KAJ5143186.1 hypothetical protein N7515_001973 [Penicillium bovifimosum]
MVDEDLESFIQVLRHWNKPDQHEILNGDYTLDLDVLGVKSGCSDKEWYLDPESQQSAAMWCLQDIIPKEGVFRFGYTHRESDASIYHCSQDATVERRYGRCGDQFPCESKLSIRPCLQSRTLTVSIHHKWHMPAEYDISDIESESSESDSEFESRFQEFSGFESESDSDSRESKGESDPEAKPLDVRIKEHMKMLNELIDSMRAEHAKGNFKYVKRVLNSSPIQSMMLVAKEAMQLENNPDMPRTGFRHPATQYYVPGLLGKWNDRRG